jgi:hypothetical protein
MTFDSPETLDLPSGAKAPSKLDPDGTAKAVPFHVS